MITSGYECDRCGQRFDQDPWTKIHRDPAPILTEGKVLTLCGSCDEVMMKWLRDERESFGIRRLPYEAVTSE